jgi:hypothetical protein
MNIQIRAYQKQDIPKMMKIWNEIVKADDLSNRSELF